MTNTSGVAAAKVPSEKDYFMLDDQNRVILVSNTGQLANTPAAPSQGQQHH